jgi:hypothetical protein
MSAASETASIILLLTRWRLLAAQNPSHRVKELSIEAQRCSRLAKGIANVALAEELEAIGRAFNKEAGDFAGSMQAAAFRIYSLGFGA